MPVTRGKDGRFIQNTPTWSLENFDAGYISNKGRFMVRMPEHPRAYQSGYILRSIVAYEAYHGVNVNKNERIHHINANKLDDSEKNLQLVTTSEHRKIHARLRGAYVKKVCESCGKEFEITKGRLNDTSSGKRGRFCSQKCYHAFKRSDEHKQHISDGLKNAYKEGRRNERKSSLYRLGRIHS